MSALKTALPQAGLVDDAFVAWAGIRGLDALQFSPFLPIHMVVCPDAGSDISSFCSGRILHSLEQTDALRKNPYAMMHNLFSGPFGRTVKCRLASQGKEVHLLCYHSDPEIEALVTAYPHINLMSAPASLKALLDNKVVLPSVLPRLDIPVMEGEVTPMAQLTFDGLARKYGLPFVLQIPEGAAGRGTLFVYGREQFDSWKHVHVDKDIKVTRFMEGTSFSINGVVMPDRVVCSQPNIQIVGQPELVRSPTSYCGTDFTATPRCFDKNMVATMYNYARSIGKWLDTRGFQGMFGLDGIVTATGEIFISEINARFTGENQFIADFQVMSDMVPLSFFHVAAFLDISIPPGDWAAYEEQLTHPLTGSCLTLHNIHSGPVRVNGELKAGIYRCENGRLKYLRDGWSLSEAQAEDEFCVTSGVPFREALIDTDAILLRIQTFDSVLRDDLKTLDENATSLISAVLARLDLSDAASGYA